ncbi:MAG: metallophosphoesterase, partial [Myxococcota bacterium]
YSYYYDQAKKALDWTVSCLSKENLAWLGSLPYIQPEAEISTIFSHGSPHEPEEFHYIFNMEQAQEAYQHQEDLLQVTFIGHSHLCRVFTYDQKDVTQMVPGLLELSPDKKYIISVGSVGQPRDYDPRAAYAIFDTESRTFEQFRLSYPIQTSARRSFEANLPDAFGKRLYFGI